MNLSYFVTASIFAHLALLFYVLALLARRELVLRGLLLIGTGFYLLYYFNIADAPLWDAIWASVGIAAANLFMIGVILRERSTFGMSTEMLGLYASFPTMNPGQFRTVMKMADWISAREETVICTEGEEPDFLFLISKGTMMLKRDGKQVSVGAGNFIGEISFLIDGPARADVVATQGTDYVRWDRQGLSKLMEKSPRLSNALTALLNKDVARKLSVSWPEAPTS